MNREIPAESARNGEIPKFQKPLFGTTPPSALSGLVVQTFLNGRLRDECLNEHWFPTLLHARTEIERWRREYNEERPKKAIGGMTPSAYAQQLANAAIINPGL
ncbi:UNVERIFIED_ORG: transposase InsO family protein [Xanthomonas axonopodis]